MVSVLIPCYSGDYFHVTVFLVQEVEPVVHIFVRSLDSNPTSSCFIAVSLSKIWNLKLLPGGLGSTLHDNHLSVCESVNERKAFVKCFGVLMVLQKCSIFTILQSWNRFLQVSVPQLFLLLRYLYLFSHNYCYLPLYTNIYTFYWLHLVHLVYFCV